jgi:APA family basic amino acid/polyamine antiporter
MLSFVVAGITCVFAALCYAEFASMVPVAGSAYTYAYATLGELFAWIIGWDLILEYAVASSTVAHGWSHYFQDFLEIFHVGVPHVLTNAPFDYSPTTGRLVLTGTWVDFPAIAIALIITAILVKGIRESASVNAALESLDRSVCDRHGLEICKSGQLETLCAIWPDRDRFLWPHSAR